MPAPLQRTDDAGSTQDPMNTTTQEDDQLAAAEQTPRRKKIRRRFARMYGLTNAQILAATKLRDQLAANPAMQRVGWDDILGSNEWKMRRAFSCSTGKLSEVEFVIGKAVAA